MRNAVTGSLGLDPKMAPAHSREHVLLSACFLLIYITLANIGRDVFFNHNLNLHAEEDIIGKMAPYVRTVVCLFSILVVTSSSGLTWGLSKVPLALAPYCAYALLSSFWSVDLKASLRGSLTLMSVWPAMTMIIHRIGAVQAVRLSLYLMAWVCVASALLALFVPSIGRHNMGDLIQAGHAGQWRGIFSHKNGLGPWSAYGATLILFYGRLMRARPLFRWGSWGCAVACWIFAGSVTSWLLGLFCVCIHLAMKVLRRFPLAWVLIGLAVFGALGTAIAFLESELMFAAVGRDASFSGRWDIWKFAWTYVVERPWFGHGYQTLGGDDFLAREQMVFLQPIPGPESGYVDLLLEQGIVGFVLFFVPYFMSIRNGFEWIKHVRRDDADAIGFFLIVLISTLMEGFSETNSLIPTGYDGVVCFAAFFSLLTAPKSPVAAHRSTRQEMRHWRPARGRRTSTARDRAEPSGEPRPGGRFGEASLP